MRLDKIYIKSSTLPFAFLTVIILAYGLLIPWLGFYWDDWPYSWFAHILGPSGFVKAFAHDRPFLSLIYIITTPLLGQSMMAWQVFCLLTRLLTVLSFWWTLKKIWPANSRQNAWAALLFAVFPGFGQQWISVIYSQAFIILAAHLFSFGCMLWALKAPRWYWHLTALALFCSAFSLFSTEYFFGLELLRPIILWISINKSGLLAKSKVKKIALHWLPYLILSIGYGAYRFWLLGSSSYQGYELQGFENAVTAPKMALFQIFETIIDTFGKAGLAAWSQNLELFLQPLNSSATWLAMGLAAAAFLVTIFYLQHLQLKTDPHNQAPSSDDQWGYQAALLGICGIFLGRLPSWAAGLPLSLDFPWDRFMLSTIFGASLFLMGTLEYLIKTEKRRLLLVAAILALSISTQFQSANSFRRAWNLQKEFFWQLTWRIPGLEPGTMLMTHELPLQYYSDYSLSAPLVMTYEPDYQSTQKMPYILLYTKARLKGSLESLEPNTSVDFDYRATSFSGNTNQTVTIYFPYPGCLRVMDGRFTNQNTLDNLPYQLTSAIPLSNLNLIRPEPETPARPPVAIFGSEPGHGWCFYFEKAELARQQEKWNEVLDLYLQAQATGIKPFLQSENLPFVEAYARENQWETALDLARTSIQNDPKTRFGFCQTLIRVFTSETPNQDVKENFNTFNKEQNCGY